MTGILVRLENGAERFAVGSMVDGHTSMIHSIELQHGVVKTILWAGELFGDFKGIQIANGTAGLLRYGKNDTAWVFPKLDWPFIAHVQTLQKYVDKTSKLKSLFTSTTIYRAFEAAPQHLHQSLNALSDYRHNFAGLINHVAVVHSLMLLLKSRNELTRITALETELIKSAYEMLVVINALKEFKVPLVGIEQFETIAVSLAQGNEISEDKIQLLIAFMKSADQPTSMFSVIEL